MTKGRGKIDLPPSIRGGIVLHSITPLTQASWTGPTGPLGTLLWAPSPAPIAETGDLGQTCVEAVDARCDLLTGASGATWAGRDGLALAPLQLVG